MNFLNICRVCLSENEGMISIFDSYTFAECYLDISEVMTNCASVQIHKLDGFSEQICKTCLGDLSQAYRFKHLCEESDYKFRNNLIVAGNSGILPEEETTFKFGGVNEKNKDDGLIKIKSEIEEEETNFLANHEDNITKSLTDITALNNPGSSLKTDPLISDMLPEEDIKIEYCEVNSEINWESEEETASSYNGLCEIKNENEESSLQKTEITAKEKSNACKFCSQCFDNRKSLNNHIVSYHNKPYKCEICNKYFGIKAVLIRHKETHAEVKSYKCKICDKYFRTKAVLMRHQKIHTGVKPYKCDMCDKCFNVKANMNIHRTIHTGGKQFNCKICDKTYRCQSALYSHNTLHTGERPFKCETCGKCFREKAKLTTHKRIHTGERPYKCEVCSKSFTQRKTLVDHLKIHTAEKPYKCDFCNKGFTQKSNLNTHVRIHTGDKPYKCGICSEYFRHHTALIRHNKTHKENS